MTAYALIPVSYDSNSVQSSDFQSWFLREDNVLGTVVAQAVDVDRPFNSPKTVGTQKQGKAYPLHIRLVSGVDETKLNTLKTWFASSQSQKYLKVTNGAGTTLRVACVSRGLLATDNAVEWIANLWADDGTLEADSASTDTHNACSGDTHDLSHTSGGNAPPSAVFTIKPIAVKATDHAPAYQQQRLFTSNADNPLTDPNGDGWPVMIISAWDTATIIAAGHMQADGDDLRVFVDGVEVNRWLDGINTAATKVWANIPFPAQRRAALKAAMSAGGAEDVTADTAGAFSTWPPSGYFQISAEVVWYGSRTNEVLSGILRAQKTTSAASHTLGTSLRVLPHDIRLAYGCTTSVNPPADTNAQPMIDLNLSDNTHFTWPAAYSAPGTRRTAQFIPGSKPLNTLSPLQQAFETAGKLYFRDSAPAAGFNQGDLWYFPAPTGITAIEHDVAVPSNMLLNVRGTDGVADKLLATYNPDTDGDDKTITLTATLYDVRYEGLVRTVTAAEPTVPVTDDAYPAKVNKTGGITAGDTTIPYDYATIDDNPGLVKI